VGVGLNCFRGVLDVLFSQLFDGLGSSFLVLRSW
jgi:hypothetical protein